MKRIKCNSSAVQRRKLVIDPFHGLIIVEKPIQSILSPLTRYEMETICNYNAGAQTAAVYTRDKAVVRKLDALCAAYPNIYRQIGFV